VSIANGFKARAQRVLYHKEQSTASPAQRLKDVMVPDVCWSAKQEPSQNGTNGLCQMHRAINPYCPLTSMPVANVQHTIVN
jgi:hypothetical protein